MFFPPLAIPLLAIEAYTAQKFANNTVYTSFKDLAFVTMKKGKNIKIYQDIMRPDILKEVRKLDTREKLGFLQLQALVGMTKFDINDKNGNPRTLETDSHGIIRKTFQKLSEEGYIQNYKEKHIKDGKLVLPKLAFANRDIGKKTEIYNMQFQRTAKPIDFNDPNFRKMFPAVFGKTGILTKRGYTVEKDSEGRLQIDYSKRKEQPKYKKKEKTDFRESLRVDNYEQQREIENNISRNERENSISRNESPKRENGIGGNELQKQENEVNTNVNKSGYEKDER